MSMPNGSAEFVAGSVPARSGLLTWFYASTFGITFALLQPAFALVQFHLLKVTCFVYGGDVETFRWPHRVVRDATTPS